jgi:thioredoxin-like negative regulator of GroEL
LSSGRTWDDDVWYGSLESAIEDYQARLARDPADVKARVDLAIVRMLLRMRDPAQPSLLRLLSSEES